MEGVPVTATQIAELLKMSLPDLSLSDREIIARQMIAECIESVRTGSLCRARQESDGSLVVRRIGSDEVYRLNPQNFKP